MPDLKGTYKNWRQRRRNHLNSSAPWFYQKLDLAYGVIEDGERFRALRKGVIVARENNVQEFKFGMGFASRLTINDAVYDFGSHSVVCTHEITEEAHDWRRFIVRFREPVARLTVIPFFIRFDLLRTPRSHPPDPIWQWRSGYAVDELSLRVTLPGEHSHVWFRVTDGTPEHLIEEEIPCDPVSRDFRKDIPLAAPNLTYSLNW